MSGCQNNLKNALIFDIVRVFPTDFPVVYYPLSKSATELPRIMAVFALDNLVVNDPQQRCSVNIPVSLLQKHWDPALRCGIPVVLVKSQD